MPATATNARAITKIWFARYWSFSPFLLATSAETETFVAINRASPINLGFVVSPTAATA